MCTPYKQEGEEPYLRFHIVSDGAGGCVILPASEQYHSIQPFQWYENGELVKQHDHFHPGTREAVLKTDAHGDNYESTLIFQGKDATKSRRSTNFGLMVTAFGGECHVNKLTDELGIYIFKRPFTLVLILGMNPEHMLAPGAGGSVNNSLVNSKTQYVQNIVTAAKIISPDDDTVKLTETMKKACEGKAIYYNDIHFVESEEEFRLGVRSVQSKDKKLFEKMLPNMPKNLKIDQRTACLPGNIKVNKYKHKMKGCLVFKI